MRVFDTITLPVGERADAVSAAMLDATLTTNLSHHDPARVHLRIDSFLLGHVELNRVATSGMDTTRTARQTASDEEPTVALVLGMTNTGVIEQDDRPIATRVGVVHLVELTRPYFSRIPHGTDGWSVKIPLADLGLRRDTVPLARARIAASPMQRLYAGHLGALGRTVPELDAPAAALVGTATTALARALICSAAGRDDAQTREALADSLLLRVQAYVRAHLADPHLSAPTIAAAHHVSVRHLYKLFAAADLSLEQWIIEERLEAAHRDLARHGVRHRTIAATARRWGFADASHFTRRFRERYGVTPSEHAETSIVHAEHDGSAATRPRSPHERDT